MGRCSTKSGYEHTDSLVNRVYFWRVAYPRAGTSLSNFTIFFFSDQYVRCRTAFPKGVWYDWPYPMNSIGPILW